MSSSDSGTRRAAIVGAGPAGSAVGEILSKTGIAHDLFDEQPRAGGNIGRRRFDAPPQAPEGAPHCRYRAATRVLSVSPERLLTWDDGQAIHRESYDAVFLCAGAYDGMLPRAGRFDTWCAAGSLQALLKGQGVVPDGPVLIAGSGPFLHIVAADLVRAGAKVAAVVDALPRLAYVNLLPYALPVLGNIGIMRDAQRVLHGAGVPVRFGRRVATLARDHAVLDTGTRIDFAIAGITDWFAPQTQLARSAGCAQEWSEHGRYFVTTVDSDYRTDREAIFVLGEGAGVRGGPHARLSGLVAALAWLHDLHHPAPGGYDHHALARQAQDVAAFGQALEATMTKHEPDMDDAAWACACERVPVSAVRDAVATGLEDLSSIKIVTRCGMGTCQGRYCEPVVGRVIAEHHHATPRGGLTQKVLARPLDVSELTNG